MGSRAICVSVDVEVRRIVGEALAATGIPVEHHAAVPQTAADVALIVVDRATRVAAGNSLRSFGAPVVVVGDDLDDDGLITLMLEAPVSHLVEDPGDRDLTITSEKLASGDLFGLEKYLALGTEVGQRVIANDADKRNAIGAVAAWAEASGARRPIVHRIENVVDELLMNALIDAPRTRSGTTTSRAVLRWACDDNMIAISVGDEFGALRQRDVIDHVRRARDERGSPRPSSPVIDGAGAGLGLYLVLANVVSLIVNVEPGRRTEVVCLFDLAHGARRAVESGVRSLHVFRASP